MKTLMNLILMFAAITSSACVEVPPRKIAPELEEWVVRFEQKYNTEVNYPVTFADDTELGHFEGLCEVTGGVSRIVIDKSFYEETQDNTHNGDLAMEMLLFHELGHCSFDLEHDNEWLPIESDDGTIQSASYMHGDSPVSSYEVMGQDYYQTELGKRIQCKKDIARGNMKSSACLYSLK